MLQLKKIIIRLVPLVLCASLSACSDRDDSIVLIGEESRGATSTLEKNGRIIGGHPDVITGESADVADEADGIIRVYVCGAVVAPGVVEIPADSRVENALDAAGGFTENADCTYVNLAAWVLDGQMLYFPTVEEVCGSREQLVGEQLWESGMVYNSDTGVESLVNINTADVEKLCTLPGIGESRARDIIAYREANGFFKTCEDIMCVPGIKTGVFEKIRDRISVK